jgi:hypothetical protein
METRLADIEVKLTYNEESLEELNRTVLPPATGDRPVAQGLGGAGRAGSGGPVRGCAQPPETPSRH